MFNKKKLLFLCTGIIAAMGLTGCNLSLSLDKDSASSDSIGIARDLGIINYEESTLGIPVNSENITSLMEDGEYYVLHDDVLYPCYTDMQMYDGITEGLYENDPRFDIFTSQSIINIPTLFEGDKLLYYSTSGILDYYTLERFKDLGWSIGIRNLQSTEAGYVYVDVENEDDYPYILDSCNEIREIIGNTLLIDKIGGQRLYDDYVEDGIINGLVEGVTYDLEVYNGTNYYYYDVNVNTKYFKSMELYAEAEYLPLQDYLYEIELPDYLLNGYYEIDAKGMFRLVHGTEYDDYTDFNQKLLYEFVDHADGDMSLSENKIPGRYSSISDLKIFRPYDEGCFGHEDNELTLDDLAGVYEEIAHTEGMANFIEASKTQTDLWLPNGMACTITIESEESTGSIYLLRENGRKQQVPFDRINKYYQINVDGKDEKVTLIVQGLYHDYQITLLNAQGYRDQGNDSSEDTEEAKEEE